MKTIAITLLACSVIVAAGCSSAKKVTVAAPPAKDSSIATTPAPAPMKGPYVFLPPAPTGIRMPGSADLAAIQTAHPDATLSKLREGYMIYTEGACVKCHDAISIYKFEETQWKPIMDDMAKRAMLSAAEKDAVYKYVLAIKATQPKDATCKSTK